MKVMKGIPEADAYVCKNIIFASKTAVGPLTALQIHCIDGRHGKHPDQLGKESPSENGDSTAFPGGGIGMAALILSAINTAFIERWAKDGDPRADSAKEKFNFARVMDCVERSLGGMSGHTDDSAIDDALACAGCGHAKALLTQEEFGLGATYRAEMTEYLKKLKVRALAGEEGIVIHVYHGKHVESAVLRLKCNLSFGEFLSVPPTDGEMSVFVFNEHMALEVLAKISGLLYEELRADFKAHGISKEEFTTHVASLYHYHVRSIASKLAHDLPVYDVVHTQKGCVAVHTSDLRF